MHSSGHLGAVMITGGAGFLGLRLASMICLRKLAQSLLLFDARVIDGAKLPAGVQLTVGDLQNFDDCSVRGFEINCCVNISCRRW